MCNFWPPHHATPPPGGVAFRAVPSSFQAGAQAPAVPTVCAPAARGRCARAAGALGWPSALARGGQGGVIGLSGFAKNRAGATGRA